MSERTFNIKTFTMTGKISDEQFQELMAKIDEAVSGYFAELEQTEREVAAMEVEDELIDLGATARRDGVEN